MSRIPTTLTRFADDVAWHVEGFLHGAFDLASAVALGVMVYAAAVPAAQVAGPQALVMQGPVQCEVARSGCITARVLDPQDS